MPASVGRSWHKAIHKATCQHISLASSLPSLILGTFLVLLKLHFHSHPCPQADKKSSHACSAGFAIPGTQVRIVNPETMTELPDGQQGLVQARGPGVMAGYFNDEENTKKAFAPGNGWFDTGDLGWRAPGGSPPPPPPPQFLFPGLVRLCLHGEAGTVLHVSRHLNMRSSFLQQSQCCKNQHVTLGLQHVSKPELSEESCGQTRRLYECSRAIHSPCISILVHVLRSWSLSTMTLRAVCRGCTW